MAKHTSPTWPETGKTHGVSVAIIGGVPDPVSAALGKPFSGAEGRMLESILRVANLDKGEFLYDYVFDHIPTGGAAAALRDPNALAEAQQRLAEVLTKASPDVIVPVGDVALFAFTGLRNISTQRGYVTEATAIRPGAKLIPTLEPDTVRKMWKLLPVVVSDFVKAAKEAQRGPKIIQPRRRLMIMPTFDEVRTILTKWRAEAEILSVDIETGWGQITNIGFAPTEELALNVPFVDLSKPNRSYWPNAITEMRVWQEVIATLESAIPKVGQNMTYDIAWLLEKRGAHMMNYRHDTRLLHHALYAELPKSLEFMASLYGSQGSWKGWGGRYSAMKRDDS